MLDLERHALYVSPKTEWGCRFVLYDMPSFKGALSSIRNPIEVADGQSPALSNSLMAYINAQPSDQSTGKCYGAWSILTSARNPKFKGMGRELYKIVSQYLVVPIMSDRGKGTSPAAQSVWKKMAQSGDFQATPEFDHFQDLDGKRQYYDTQDKGYKGLAKPRTKTTEDDCHLPDDFDTQTPFALKANGSGDIEKLLENHKHLVAFATKKVKGLKPSTIEQGLLQAGQLLFGREYGNVQESTMHTSQEYRFILEAKQAGDKKALYESSLSRVYKHYMDMTQGQSSFAMLTAWRAAHTPAENNRLQSELIAQLHALNLGFIKLKGYWQECQDDSIPYQECPPEMLKATTEASLFVIGISFDDTLNLIRQYNQDAAVYAGQETGNKVSLVFKDGSTDSLGEFSPDAISQAYSQIKGQSFHFEGLAWQPSTRTDKLIHNLFG